jgi:hypothetical protein
MDGSYGFLFNGVALGHEQQLTFFRRAATHW